MMSSSVKISDYISNQKALEKTALEDYEDYFAKAQKGLLKLYHLERDKNRKQGLRILILKIKENNNELKDYFERE